MKAPLVTGQSSRENEVIKRRAAYSKAILPPVVGSRKSITYFKIINKDYYLHRGLSLYQRNFST